MLLAFGGTLYYVKRKIDEKRRIDLGFIVATKGTDSEYFTFSSDLLFAYTYFRD
jgi:hypothetical protein